MFCALRDSRLGKRCGDMSDLYWLTDEQMAKLAPFLPKSYGKPRVDDRRVLSGIIFINRNLPTGQKAGEEGSILKLDAALLNKANIGPVAV